MRRTVPHQGLRARLGLAAAVLLGAGGLGASALIGGLASPALAADGVTFAVPTASGTLDSPIILRQTFSTGLGTPDRVEALTSSPGLDATEVDPATVTGGGGSYTATFALTGHVVPNTTLTYRFRVVTGSTQSVGPAATYTLLDTRYSWRVLEGRYVRLHWYDGDSAFAQRALSIGDQAVARVSALLGVTEDQPIDFFIYDSPQGLDGALGPGTSEFVAGRAVPEIRTLFAEIDPSQIDSGWVGVVIPHELTHLVFDTATRNPEREPPLWLNEGLAVYEAQGYDPPDQQRVRDAVRAGRIIPLDGLRGPFPQSQTLFYQSYAEAVSAIDFLVRRYGQADLVRLVRSYGAGVTDDQAFQAGIGTSFTAFQAAWLADIGAGTPRSYGPQPAPAGSLPPGWTAGGGPLPTATSGGASGPSAPTSSGAASGAWLVAVGAGALALLLAALALLALVLRARTGPRPAGGPRPPSEGGAP